VIPYQIVNGLEFYQRKEIKDVLAYLHLLNNPRSDVALLRIINTPTRGIGKSSLQKLQEHARRKQIPLLDAAREAGLIKELNKKSALAIAKFVAMYDRLGESVLAPLEEIVGKVLTETGYREVLQNSEAEEDQERLANLEELLTAAREFDIRNPGQGNLEQFLEESSLVADTDAWEAETDKVTLMTLHAAKGLEFPCVFIIACEQGLLPHERSIKDYDRDKLEEERRLMFVGITRAMERLQLSYAQYRTFRGLSAPTVPSMFLMELPRHEMDQSSNLAALNATSDWEEPEGDVDFDFGANVDDSSQLPAHDDEYSQLDEPRPKKQREKTLTSGLLTAADLLARQESPGRKVPINAFKHGMTVSHPEHGLGTITALAGEGPKRTATVQFFGDSQERKFRLLFANLTPVEE
jgi:DNA helicase-2/ATP-dependent DNA helicase PcrA